MKYQFPHDVERCYTKAMDMRVLKRGPIWKLEIAKKQNELAHKLIKQRNQKIIACPICYLSESKLFVKWYRYGGHLEKRVIETKLLEVRYDNEEKELFEAV